MFPKLPIAEKRGFESHQLGGNSGWHLWNHSWISERKKPETVDATGEKPVASIPFWFYGAGGGTRTHTDFTTRFWVAVVCQFRHTGIYILISLVSRTSQILEGCAGGILKSNEIMKLWKRRFIKGFARALNILRSRFWVRCVCQFLHIGNVRVCQKRLCQNRL